MNRLMPRADCMLNQERQQKILEFIRADGTVRVSKLSDILRVSEGTIRRDLDILDTAGLIQRIHGGAIIGTPTLPEAPVISRMNENAQAKRRIGKAAADLIQEGETIFISTGTTANEVARNLCNRSNITVITNSLLVLNTLSQAENISTIGLGGLLRRSELSLIGYLTEQGLKELHPQRVFMGIRAVSLRLGLSNEMMTEVATDRVIISSAPQIVLLADHTKFDKFSTAMVAPISVVSTLVTDDATPADIIAGFRKRDIEVIVA